MLSCQVLQEYEISDIIENSVRVPQIRTHSLCSTCKGCAISKTTNQCISHRFNNYAMLSNVDNVQSGNCMLRTLPIILACCNFVTVQEGNNSLVCAVTHGTRLNDKEGYTVRPTYFVVNTVTI